MFTALCCLLAWIALPPAYRLATSSGALGYGPISKSGNEKEPDSAPAEPTRILPPPLLFEQCFTVWTFYKHILMAYSSMFNRRSTSNFTFGTPRGVDRIAVISTVLKGGGPKWTVPTCLATPTTTFAHAVATTTLHCASLPFDPTHDHVHFTLTAQTTAVRLIENVSALSTPDGFDLFIGTPDDSRNGFVSRQHHRHIPIHRVNGDSWHYTFVAAVDAATATRVSYSISVLRRALELGTDQQRHAVYTALATGARLPAMPDHIDGLTGFAPDLFTAIPPARSVKSTAGNA